jgi:glycosyltransferase involved in cell wall biosynthesis
MDAASNLVAVVILAKNEEQTLARCLDAIPSGYRVHIVDSGSTDETLEIARVHSCVVHEHPWMGYAQQRNYALACCGITAPWVLFIDADEVFPLQFFEWIEASLDRELAAADAVMVPSYLYLRGKRLKYAPGYPIFHPRLVRAWVRFLALHEGGFGENVPTDCRIIHTHIPYAHYFYEGELLEWLHKHVDHANREIRAHNLARITINRRKRINLMLGNSVLRAPARFVYHYLLRGGFLDGRAGLEFSLMFAWYEATKYLVARYGGRPQC